jgi:putative membrane protein
MSAPDEPDTGARRSWGRSLEVGEEPDPRFSFANERTFLAWNRTALGCVVAGLAVSHVLAPDDDSDVGPKVAGVALMVLGGLLALFSYSNWTSAQRALRLQQPLPRSLLPTALSVVTAAVAVVTIVYTLA